MYDVANPLVVGSCLSACYNSPPTSNLASSDQRCHCLGFLSRSWVFRSNLGFLGFFLRALGFSRVFERTLGFSWVFKISPKINFCCCFLQKVRHFLAKNGQNLTKKKSSENFGG